MRIIAGKYKSLSLTYPKDKSFRPTQDRVKEALFSIISDRIFGSRFLDLCSGTGGIGFEAISRGAEHVTLVDTNTKTIKENLERIIKCDPGAKEKIKIIKANDKQFFKRNTVRFDICFIDPPWDKKSIYETSLKAIFDSDILQPDGLLVVEHNQNLNEWMQTFIVQKQYRYGDTILSLLTSSPGI